MKFIIGKKDDFTANIDLSNRVNPPTISAVNRTQTVKYTLGGAAIIDRVNNSLKHTMELSIPLISKEEWDSIKAIICEMSFKVYWDDAGYEMRLVGELPTPVVAAGEDSYLVGDIKLEFEEM